VVLALLVAGACSGDDGDDAAPTRSSTTTTVAVPERGGGVASPTLTGPVTGGIYGVPYNPMPTRLADEHGYVEAEYLVSGTATSYQPVGTWGDGGRWRVRDAETAPYTTRILVRRPVEPDEFSGTVVIEWHNVSAGIDADPDFGALHPEAMRRGIAWVGVSAQRAGVHGGGFKIPIEGFDARPLQEWDPERYAELEHPGDDFSYDIFSQVAQAVRRPGALDPMDGLDVRHVLATGESQSATRLVTYVNAVHPVADIYDGFLVHSRGGGGASIDGDAPGHLPATARIRTDLDVPVLQVETETDLLGLGFAGARQPDTDLVRTWEIAGTAHADQALVDYGVESGRVWSTDPVPDFAAMCGPLNAGPHRFVLRAAFAALHAWVVEGRPPPDTAEPIEVVDGEIVRDALGNARGGVRTPHVDAPVARLSGEPDPGDSIICSLFGATEPLPDRELTSLYPTRDDYVEAVEDATDDAIAAGVLLAADRDAVIAAAEIFPVGAAEPAGTPGYL
jgi:hypothetical protein